MEAITTYRGRIINKSDIDLINRIIEAHPQKSRRFISQEVCRVWNWRQPNSHLKDMICRSLLLLLESKGFIKLPARKCTPLTPLANRKKPEEIPVDQSSIQCPLKQLLPVSLHQVHRTTDEKLFNSLIEHYHYLSEKERKETKQRKKIARLTGSKSTIRKNVMLIKLYFLLTHNLRAMKKLLFKISDLKPSTLSSLKKSTTHLLRIKPGLPLYHPAMRENSAPRLRALSSSFILILTSPNPKSLIFFMMQKLSFLPARSQSS